jgi:hypothetical protein
VIKVADFSRCAVSWTVSFDSMNLKWETLVRSGFLFGVSNNDWRQRTKQSTDLEEISIRPLIKLFNFIYYLLSTEPRHKQQHCQGTRQQLQTQLAPRKQYKL